MEYCAEDKFSIVHVFVIWVISFVDVAVDVVVVGVGVAGVAVVAAVVVH